jgi:bifunctional enzyme CysN/CysC
MHKKASSEMDTKEKIDEKFSAENYLKRELLRFTTAGSVDDGKSTLIGRMLFDSKQIFQDQMDALERSSRLRGEENVNLALLTDGLRAEREQGITIDVAYRYFSTPRRKFIIADTPGHEQYTRNMVTGASTADLAVILIDARNGVLTQSRRHGFIASLLGIPHLLVAVNKMDLVGWSQEVFDKIVEDYTEFSEKLNVHDITFIPVSALLGDNVVEPSENMPWYQGETVLRHLETVTIAADRNLVDFRFPVQYVVRPHLDFRGYAGRISSGTIKPGEEIMVLPSGMSSKVKEIVTADGNLEEAFDGQSVILTLEDEIDISRGDMIVRKKNIPLVDTKFDAILSWMDEEKSLSTTNHYLLQQTTRLVSAYVRELTYRIDVNTLHRDKEAGSLELNEIGRVRIETSAPLFFDEYDRNRETGGFILIDPATNRTVAAGMIRGQVKDYEGPDRWQGREISSNVKWEQRLVTREMREARNQHEARCLWLTGLSGSGKTTIAKKLEKELFEEGKQVYLLDGDNMRHGLNGDLGFSEKDRHENIRRVGHVARLMYDAGFIVICCFISPKREVREAVKGFFPEGGFKEIYIECDLEECKRRDPKGLYEKAAKGEIENFTGVSAPYEKPMTPDLSIDTVEMQPDEAVRVIKRILL